MNPTREDEKRDPPRRLKLLTSHTNGCAFAGTMDPNQTSLSSPSCVRNRAKVEMEPQKTMLLSRETVLLSNYYREMEATDYIE